MRQEALKSVYEIAKSNKEVLFIGSDLGVETLKEMRIKLPKQFFMEGISEQHLIGFAAGLAKEGFVPYLNTIANFLSRRALEQLILDVALHKLPVKLLASGGGMVYAPLGPTHTATDDLAHVLAIPNLQVYAPADAHEMREFIVRDFSSGNPSYFRFGKGGDEIVSDRMIVADSAKFKFIGDTDSPNAIITTGIALQPAFHAVLSGKFKSKITLIHIPHLNIMQDYDLYLLLKQKKSILIVEEHQKIGGLLTQVLHFLNDFNLKSCTVSSINLGHGFIRKYGSQDDHLKEFGITSQNIVERILNANG